MVGGTLFYYEDDIWMGIELQTLMVALGDLVNANGLFCLFGCGFQNMLLLTRPLLKVVDNTLSMVKVSSILRTVLLVSSNDDIKLIKYLSRRC